MKKHILTSLLYTVITALILGIGYPLAITAIARALFPAQAAGQLLYNGNGQLIGSRLVGQTFTGDLYFHGRPSSAGTGYDAASSSGSNLGPTNKALSERVQQSVGSLGKEQVPIDLVTASASGLDPDITPAAALFQVARVAHARGLSEARLTSLVQEHATPRWLGLLGEPRVNVLELNVALDRMAGR